MRRVSNVVIFGYMELSQVTNYREVWLKRVKPSDQMH